MPVNGNDSDDDDNKGNRLKQNVIDRLKSYQVKK